MTIVHSNHGPVRRARYGGSARPALGILVGLGLAASACKPELVVVTTTADGQPGSLRAAIASINEHPGLTDAVIQLPPGTYELTVCGSDDSNALGDLDVVSSAKVVLESSGSAVIRQTCAGERVLDAHGATLLTLRGVSVVGGSLTTAGPAQGGGLRATGDVTLERAQILDNSATTSAFLAQGGGLYVAGALSMYDSVVARNTAAGARANDATRELGKAEGGGAYAGAAVVISGSTLSDNTVSTGRISEARGGAIAQSLSTEQPFSVVRTRLENNQATGGDFSSAEGGAVSASGVFTTDAVVARGNRATGGQAQGGFGGRAGAARGGAFAARRALLITASTFDANRAVGGVAPYLSLSGAPPYFAGSGSGGAVWAAGALTLTGSTFTENTAEDGAGHLDGALSGGGAAFTHATLDAANTTFSGNAAVAKIPIPGSSPYFPGGLPDPGLGAVARALTSVQLRHATLADNRGNNSLYTPLLSTRASVALASSGRICSSTVTSEASDYNRFADASCSLQGVDNQQDGAGITLEPLADNGGPVLTHRPSGALIDAVPAAACTLPHDARGITRPQGAGCDVGAVEIRPEGN